MDADVRDRARDALYTAVGFGVLAAQRLQVRRRDLARELSQRMPPGSDLARMVRQAQAVADPVLDLVEHRLPQPGRTVFRQARRAARGVQETVTRR